MTTTRSLPLLLLSCLIAGNLQALSTAQPIDAGFNVPDAAPDFFRVFLVTSLFLNPEPSDIAERQTALDAYILARNERPRTTFQKRKRNLIPDLVFDPSGAVQLARGRNRSHHRRLQSIRDSLNFALNGLCVGCGRGDVFDLQVTGGPGPGETIVCYNVGFISLADTADSAFAFEIDNEDTAQIQHVDVDFIYGSLLAQMETLELERETAKAALETSKALLKSLRTERRTGSPVLRGFISEQRKSVKELRAAVRSARMQIKMMNRDVPI